MAVSAKLYTKAFLSVFNKELDIDTDVVKVMLCSASYTPDQAVHQYKSSVTGEITGTGYTAGGQALATASISTSGNTFKFDADDSMWPSSTLSARYAVIYVEKGSAATSPLIGYVDFGADVSTTSGTFQSIWNSNGIFTVTVA